MASERYQVGDRLGHWTILEKMPPQNHGRRWRVRCDCGAVAVRFAINLIRGTSKSCGECGQRRRRAEGR
jgi:hypothetical protein